MIFITARSGKPQKKTRREGGEEFRLQREQEKLLSYAFGGWERRELEMLYNGI